MNYRTEIKIQDDKFFVAWRSGPDPDDNDGEILECPEEMLKKYREPLILYVCKVEEEEKAEERKTERRIE